MPRYIEIAFEHTHVIKSAHVKDERQDAKHLKRVTVLRWAYVVLQPSQLRKMSDMLSPRFADVFSIVPIFMCSQNTVCME